MQDDEFGRLDVPGLADLVRCGSLSATELFEYFLAAVTARNGAVNAVVTIDEVGGRRRAAAIDALDPASRARLALCGVPFTVKDTIETRGVRTTAGSRAFARHVPARSATAVRRLESAGAVLLGKTNTPSLAGDLLTDNALFGVTRNPRDLRRTPGGSSGGGAAAVAARLIPFDLGSDHAGSLRIPASYCGVSAHRPTVGIIPSDGHIPPGPDAHARRDLTEFGPLAGAPSSIEVIIDVIAGPTTEARGWQLHLPDARPILRDLRCAVLADDPACPVASEVRNVVRSTADALADAGARVVEAALPVPLGTVDEVFRELLGASVAISLDDERFQVAVAFASSFAPDDVSHHARDARSCATRHRDWLAINERRAALAWALEKYFDDVDVLLCAATPTVAPPIDHPADRYARTLLVDGASRPFFDQLTWSALATVAGLPATVVTGGQDKSGLPVGVQLIGRRYDDRTVIALAQSITRVLADRRGP